MIARTPLDSANTSRGVVSAALAAWANRDCEGALVWFDESIVHVLNVDGEVVPFAASVDGKAALRAKLLSMLAMFYFDAFVVEPVKAAGDTVRAGILIYYRHIATNERLDTRFRFVFTVRDGLIVRMEEYHDAAYLEAFARLVGTPQAAQESPKP